MGFHARLQRWWDTLLGRPPWYRDTNVTISRTDLYTEGSAPRPPTSGEDELSLSDESPQGATRTRRSAGVNPYSNDAGFTKPRAWDRTGRD